MGLAHNDTLAASASRLYWNDWAQLSPYSPYNLRHLDPPVPAGISREEAHLFDFEDAFEDLLAVTQGRELMDLRKQADYKRRILETFHFGEPPMLWVNRLLNRDLLSNPLPPRRWEEMNPDLMAAQVQMGLTDQDSAILKGLEAQQRRLKTSESQRREMQGALANSEQLVQRLNELKQKLLNELDQDFTFNPATMLRQVEQMAKEMGRFDPEKMLSQAEEALRSLDQELEKLDPAKMRHRAEQEASESPWGKYTDPKTGEFDFDKFLHNNDEERSKYTSKASDQKAPQPDTEEDFFSAIFGALMEANASARTSVQRPHEHQKGELPVESETVEDNEHGGKTVRWSTVWADANHVQEETTVRTLDAHGNEISSEKKLVVRPVAGVETRPHSEVYRDPANNSPDACQQAGESNAAVQDYEKAKAAAAINGKSTGWFWR